MLTQVWRKSHEELDKLFSSPDIRWQVKEDEIGGVCRVQLGEEEYMQDCGWETWKADHLLSYLYFP